jgi:hypothetical protein
MPAQGDDEGMSHLGGDIPNNHKEALFQIAKNRTTRTDRVTMADLQREAIKLWLAREAKANALSEEVRDLLDDDLKADAGGSDEELINDILDDDIRGNAGGEQNA